MLKYIIILFTLVSINTNIIGQTDYYVLSLDSFQLEISKHLSEIKKKLCCDTNDLYNDLFNDENKTYEVSIDTTLFRYIPILYSPLQISYTNEKYKTNKILPIISEVLLYEKKDKKIVGSILTDKNNKHHFNFYKYKNYIGRMPMRVEDRLIYISPKQYNKIEKFISYNNKKGYFFTIGNIGGVFFILENNEIILICSLDNLIEKK
jgi:hypothetical protein